MIDKIQSCLNPEKVAIFLFHGVIHNNEYRVRNYTNKHVEAKFFESYLSGLIEAGGSPMTMDQVLGCIENRQPFAKNAFAITFDDGFENNISVAGPILEKYEVPAMIYLTTEFVENNSMSWIDKIEYAIERTKQKKIELENFNRVVEIDSVENKIGFLKLIRTYVKNTFTCNAKNVANEICNKLDVEGPFCSEDPLDKKLSWSQVKGMHESGGLISFGGHSHTHPILSFLSPDELTNELDTSFTLLKSRAGIGPRHYSYPEGLAHCYSKHVINELQARGVRCCPTAIEGLNSIDTNPFELMRVFIH
jgi:peptidoglycan/xylan/chitin deacetylase (PgdA/CDA1 family)